MNIRKCEVCGKSFTCKLSCGTLDGVEKDICCCGPCWMLEHPTGSSCKTSYLKLRNVKRKGKLIGEEVIQS
jgi:hypothetical protein